MFKLANGFFHQPAGIKRADRATGHVQVTQDPTSAVRPGQDPERPQIRNTKKVACPTHLFMTEAAIMGENRLENMVAAVHRQQSSGEWYTVCGGLLEVIGFDRAHAHDPVRIHKSYSDNLQVKLFYLMEYRAKPFIAFGCFQTGMGNEVGLAQIIVCHII